MIIADFLAMPDLTASSVFHGSIDGDPPIFYGTFGGATRITQARSFEKFVQLNVLPR